MCCLTAFSEAAADRLTETDAPTAGEKLTYARAFEAVIWATPFLNTLQMRNELERLGIDDGETRSLLESLLSKGDDDVRS